MNSISFKKIYKFQTAKGVEPGENTLSLRSNPLRNETLQFLHSPPLSPAFKIVLCYELISFRTHVVTFVSMSAPLTFSVIIMRTAFVHALPHLIQFSFSCTSIRERREMDLPTVYLNLNLRRWALRLASMWHTCQNVLCLVITVGKLVFLKILRYGGGLTAIVSSLSTVRKKLFFLTEKKIVIHT